LLVSPTTNTQANRGHTEITQGTLGGLIGSTRSRVCYFMNKFKSLGYIEYGERLRVHNSSLSGVLKALDILRSARLSAELNTWAQLARNNWPDASRSQLIQGPGRLLFPLSNLEHASVHFLGKWNAFARFLSMVQLYTLFYFAQGLGINLRPCHASWYGLLSRISGLRFAPV